MQRTPRAVYNPPPLPQYLKDVYDLKPVVGVPNDNEVKGIHAVLRTAHSVAHISGMFDPALAMSLSQHLFEVQMARYREKYPCGMFPGDMTHTPPTLPPHVSMTLEPIHGPPSDKELQDAHAAMRAYEQTAIVPSMYDAKVGMELSQHLFNIQLARYMYDAPQAELGFESEPHLEKKDKTEPARLTAPSAPVSDLPGGKTLEVPNDAGSGDFAGPHQPASTPSATSSDDAPQGVTSVSNSLLVELVETLKGMKRVMISAQQSRIRGVRNKHYENSEKYALTGNEVMNDRGELPKAKGLPKLGYDSYPDSYKRVLTEAQLVEYLQFYCIGTELIESGDTPAIKKGQRTSAERILSNFLN